MPKIILYITARTFISVLSSFQRQDLFRRAWEGTKARVLKLILISSLSVF